MTSSSETTDTPVARSRLSPPVIALGVLLLGALAYGGSRIYVARQPFEWSGTIEARTISVGSRVGGRIQDVWVREGDFVEAGAQLLTLEPGTLLAERLVAEGQLAQAQANLEKLERGARPEEVAAARARADSARAAFAEARAGARLEQIAAARARLEAAEATAKKAQLDAERIRRLLTEQAVPEAEADAADARLTASLAERDALRHRLDELKNGVRAEEQKQAEARAAEASAQAKLVESGARAEDIQAARGLVEAARGNLEAIQVRIEELVVRAPRRSRVEALDLRPGDILAPNATAAVLLEEDQLYVRIYVPETQIGFVRVGAEVPITVDSFPDRSFLGRVEHINSTGEFSPRNLQTADERADQVFATRVGVLDGREDLRAGMAAFIRVPRLP